MVTRYSSNTVKALTELKEFRRKTPVYRKLARKYKNRLLVQYFDSLNQISNEDLPGFIAETLSPKSFHGLFMRNIFSILNPDLKLVNSQLQLFLFTKSQRTDIDLFPFLNAISFSFIHLLAYPRKSWNSQLLENFLRYCVANNQQDNLDAFMEKVAKYPVKASKIKKRMQNLIKHLEDAGNPNDTQVIELLRSALTKKTPSLSQDEEEPLLPSGKRNPLYSDLQDAVNETFEENPERHLWFNHFLHSCFPNKNAHITSSFTKKVAKLIDDINGFFEACDKKMQQPILVAEKKVAKALKKVFPHATVDWMFGDVEERLKEFQKHQAEAELKQTLCLPGGELSIMSVLYYCVSPALRTLLIDQALEQKIKAALMREGVRLNEVHFEDFNQLLYELAVAQDRLSPKLLAQQQLHLFDLIFHEVFEYFNQLQKNDQKPIYEDLLKLIGFNWWEICRLLPETKETLFHQTLFLHEKNEARETKPLTKTIIASSKDHAFSQLSFFFKPEHQSLLKVEKLQHDESLQPGLKLVIANEARSGTPKPGV